MQFFGINQKVRLFSMRLELGALYEINYVGHKPAQTRFIRVTKTGYNFLNETTNKCVIGHLIYPAKKDAGNDNKLRFLMSWGWQIKKIEPDGLF